MSEQTAVEAVAIAVGNQLRIANNRVDELFRLRQYRPKWNIFDLIMDDLERL